MEINSDEATVKSSSDESWFHISMFLCVTELPNPIDLQRFYFFKSELCCILSSYNRKKERKYISDVYCKSDMQNLKTKKSLIIIIEAKMHCKSLFPFVLVW